MPTPRIRRSATVALALGLLAAAAASAAQAATVTVTGDDGNPIVVAPNAGPTVRNMKPDVGVAFPPGEGRYTLTVTDTTGAAVSRGVSCISQSFRTPSRVEYAGNGGYVVTVRTFGADDRDCARPLSTEAVGFAIVASTAVAQTTKPFRLRSADSFATNVLSLPVAQNPGADTLEVRFAPDATVGPDGAIAGNSTRTSADPATGTAQLRFPGPGLYTVVARPTGFTSKGEVGGPWSAPVRVVVVAPFDVTGGLRFLDSRGPSYAVRIKLRERSARGRVSISLARGTSGGKYRSLGSARISSLGTVAKRFSATRSGSYRLRFSYKGSGMIAAGRKTFAIKVTRRVTFG